MIYKNDNSDIKKEFKKLLTDLNITQTYIADQLHISKNQLANTFNKVNLSFTDIYKMLDVIGYDLKIEFVKRDL